MIVLVTGGARSGKSVFAEKYAASLGGRGIYMATAEIADEEMEQRIRLHKQRRTDSSMHWDAAEVPYDLADALIKINAQNNRLMNEKRPVILIDCLTLWLSNWLIQYETDPSPDRTMAKVTELVSALSHFSGDILLVTNEVGDGIVPEYSLGRKYRDLAGLMNQQIAEISQQVFLVTAGIPLELKSNRFNFEE